MKTENRFITRIVAILTLFLLVSCNLPSSPPDPLSTEQPTEANTAATEEAAVFAEPAGGTFMLWTDNSYVVYVPAGEFDMGKDETDPSDHAPAHAVTLGGFWIQQAEVSNAMYALCVSLGVCTPPTHETGTPNWYTDPEYANAPVVGVDWFQAEAYCEWIDARLPTEAEWEKAARGTTGDPYPWGDAEPGCTLLNFADCLAEPAPEVVRTYPLGASPYNLADTAGNVFEWTADWYAEDYYTASPSSNPGGPASGEARVVRGSSYLTSAEDVGIFLRTSQDPETERADLGFRCVLNGELLTEDRPVVPACTTLSFELIYPAHQWPGQEPVTPPGASIKTYCIEDNGIQYGTAVIELEPGTDPSQLCITSPNGGLTCTPDANDPLKFNCGGSAIQPGQWVTFDLCKIPSLPPFEQPVCPIFYTFIPATGMCEYGLTIPVLCQAPNVVVPGYGCQPAPVNGECPVGSYQAEYNGSPVCVPASGAKCYSQFCMADCPEGLVFNEGDFCCDYPESVDPVCPQGYTYDSTFQMCRPGMPAQANCTSVTILAASCPAKVGCWITTGGAAAAPVTTCVYPCPAGVGNGGPCNP